MPTSLVEKVRQQGPLLGAAISLNTVYAAQVMARSGFDWLFVDMEHSPMSPYEATTMVHAIVAASRGTCTPIVRVPSHGVEWIKWALDSGSGGILIPMVNNRTEMEQIVKHAVYPPGGMRSTGPLRSPYADLEEITNSFDNYLEEGYKGVCVMPMIEHVEGVKNAEEIMSTPGVDATFIGSYDLRRSMGLKGPDGTEEVYVAALKKIAALGKKLNMPIGISGSQTKLAEQIEMGFSIFTYGNDAGLLMHGIQSVLGGAKTALVATK